MNGAAEQDDGEAPGRPRRRSDLVVVDFVAGPLAYRQRQRGYEPLLRAVGLRGRPGLEVVDSTAGLGRDSFILASAGARVTLIERSAEIHGRLRRALDEARSAGGAAAEAAARMTLVHGDSRVLLPELRPAVVLVDPMHPPRGKSAAVKKEMRLLRETVGSDPDSEELVACALDSASERMVLKWPPRAELPAPLPSPTFVLSQKTVRFLVFVKA